MSFDRGSAYEQMPDVGRPAGPVRARGPRRRADRRCSLASAALGRAGYEFDRCEPELGSPPGTLVLASSTRFNQSSEFFVDDQMWFAQGREGHRVEEPQLPGRAHRFVRSDITYLEYPNGGAFFSTGAISWCSRLSAYGYDNSVSRVTANVLDRFAATAEGLSPSDGDAGR